MGKPYMPLMMGDWIRGTRGMKANVKGVYIGLLIHQYDHGYLPEDLETLTLIEPELGSVWVSLSDKFPVVSPGKRQNAKLEEVRNFWDKQRKNGQKGGRGKKLNPDVNPDDNPKANPNHNHHNDLDNDSINVLVQTVNSFMNRKNPNTMEVRMMVRQWAQKMDPKEIPAQLKAMKAYYTLKDWPIPTRIEKMTESFLNCDWVEKMKETDPEKQAETIAKAKPSKAPVYDDIGTSAPGSLG
jgi:uncharacterized protein YdaU (DUF1376 family)